MAHGSVAVHRWDQCFIPHGIGAGPTEEGVWRWRTRLIRIHFRDMPRSASEPLLGYSLETRHFGVSVVLHPDVACTANAHASWNRGEGPTTLMRPTE